MVGWFMATVVVRDNLSRINCVHGYLVVKKIIFSTIIVCIINLNEKL